MKRVLVPLVRRVGIATLLTLALLALALGIVAAGLSQIVRGLDFELLATMVAFGASLGWLVARSRLGTVIAFPLIVVTAVVGVFARVGNLAGDLFALLYAVGYAVWQAAYQRIAWQGIVNAFDILRTDIATLLLHLQAWIAAMVAGQPALDLVGLAMTWSVVLALLAAWAAWMLRREKQPLLALAPLILLLALVLAYTGREAWLMIFMLGALLALMVLVPYAAREQRWRLQQTPTAQELGFDLAVIAVPAIAGIVVLALVVPAFSPREIARWVEQWSRPAVVANTTNPFTNSLGLAPAPRPTTVFDTVSRPGLPRSHLLGAAPELLKQVALTVQTNDTSTESLPYYWLGSTYDLYTGRGWLTRSVQTSTYRANEPAEGEPAGGFRTVSQVLRNERNDGLVYAAGSVLTVDHDYQMAWRANQDLFAAQVESKEYRVESGMLVFSADELRRAGEAYPEFIRNNYLNLPEDLSPRVLGLARDLTATAPTAYDRALAIQDYLRTIPYTLDLPAPPPDRDVVDYFLFDLKRGYCDYYATAMAVLARAAGLPSRIAVGYATGKYIPSTGTYVVTEADAHSWTQVYFPNYGWIDFEPTSARSVIAYDALDYTAGDTPPLHEEGPAVVNSNTAKGRFGNSWLVIPGALLVLLAAGLALVPIDTLRLQRLPPNEAINQLYRRILRFAKYLGISVTPSHTPHQVALLMQAQFARPTPEENTLVQGQSSTTTLAEIIEIYIGTTYGAQGVPRHQSERFIREWQKVQWQLWRAVVVHKLRTLWIGVQSYRRN